MTVQKQEEEILPLGGIAEIASMLKVGKSTVSMWVDRRHSTGFPNPLYKLSMGNVYDLSEVSDWHLKWLQVRNIRGKERLALFKGSK